MNIIKTYGLLSILSLYTCLSPDKVNSAGPEKNEHMNEIVIHINSAIDMSYKDGSFNSPSKKYADELNKILTGKKVLVRKLGGQHTVSETDSIFYLSVKEEHTKQILEKIQSLSFVNGAYVKVHAEEPDMGDLNAEE